MSISFGCAQGTPPTWRRRLTAAAHRIRIDRALIADRDEHNRNHAWPPHARHHLFG
jgi:hypothetical protein